MQKNVNTKHNSENKKPQLVKKHKKLINFKKHNS